MISDKKRFVIARKDLIIAVKRARSLDDLIAMMGRKYFELTGGSDPYGVQAIQAQANVNVNLPTPPPPNGSMAPPPPPPPAQTPPPPPPPPPEDRQISQVIVKCQHCGMPLDLDRDILFCPNCGTSRE